MHYILALIVIVHFPNVWTACCCYCAFVLLELRFLAKVMSKAESIGYQVGDL